MVLQKNEELTRTGHSFCTPLVQRLKHCIIRMAIKTLDVDVLSDQAGNLYQAVAILSKRARQLSTQTKNELDEKLAYYEGFEPELEDPRFQEEQARISVDYERRPKPTERAIDEMLTHEIYFRDPSAENDG